MKKRKNYPSTKFRHSSLRRAIEKLEAELAIEDGEVNFSLSVSSGDETWTFDDVDDFFRAYCSGCDEADLGVIVNGSQESLYVSLTQYSTAVTVSGPSRSVVDRIFEPFEAAKATQEFEQTKKIDVLPVAPDVPERPTSVEKREAPISGRVFTVKDVQKLRDVAQQFLLDLTERSREFDLVLNFEDNYSWQTNVPEEVDQELKKNAKRILSFKIRVSDYATRSSIEIHATHGDNAFGNSVSVSGSNRQWVSDAFTRLIECIQSCKPQATRFRKWGNVYVFGASIVLGVTVANFASKLTGGSGTSNDADKITNTVLVFFWIAALTTALAIPFMIAIWERLTKNWPSIEIQIGPEHTFLESRRRAWLGWAVATVIVPIAVNIIMIVFGP